MLYRLILGNSTQLRPEAFKPLDLVAGVLARSLLTEPRLLSPTPALSAWLVNLAAASDRQMGR